jgi:peptide/nickel transport system substrate-binding protein
MKTNYWTRRPTMSRRRMLQGAAAAGLGAAALAVTGCGDDDGGTTPAAATTAATGGSATAAPTEQVKKGGTLQRRASNYPAPLDPYRSSDTTLRGQLAGVVYSKLFANKGVPIGPDFPSQEVLPDLAESYEVADGGLTYTMKIHPRAKWHPPVSRSVTADDVVFSFERFFGRAGGAPPAANTDQFSMVDSVKAIDKGTVQFKLKAPNAIFLIHLADDYVMPIMPTETGTAFDPSQTLVGSGAFMIDSLNPGVSFNLKRFPEWHLGPDKPYLDAIANNVIKEPATAMTQFKGGNLDSFGPVPPKDLKEIKDAVKNAQIFGLPVTYMGFVALSGKDKSSPWNKDVRVRYAMSMAIDRNALFDVLYSPNDLKAAGIEPPKTVWHGMLPAGLGPQWLDPQGPKMDAKLKANFVYDVTKAKQLLADAGYPDGFSAEYHYTNVYGANWVLHAELVQQMLGKIGIKLAAKLDDYASVYLPKTFGGGDFDGLAMIYQGFANPLDYFSAMYIPGSPRNQSRVDDPQLTQRIQKVVQNLDAKARTDEVLSVQNYLAEKMYNIPAMYDSGPSYTAWQANIKGLGQQFISRSGAGFVQDPIIWKA